MAQDSSESVKQFLIGALQEIEAQMIEIFDALSEEQYQSIKSDYSSIGAHCRHVIEFIQAVDIDHNVIDYDARERKEKIETSKEFAKEILKEQVAKSIEVIKTKDIFTPVDVKEKLSRQYETVSIPSLFAREVAFAVQHATHHISLIRMSADLLQNVQFDAAMGTAPATLAYQGK